MANTKITSGVIAADAVLTANITDANVTTAKIAADAVTSAKVADDAINSEHLAADSIDAEHYAAGSVDATAIASNAVTTAKINNDAVTTAKIADTQITTAKMAANSITSAKLDTNIAIAGTLDVAGAVVFNEGSADVDFRVESNGNANMLFVDGGNNRVGVGTGTLNREFTVSKADQCDVAITAANNQYAQLCFGDPDDDNIGVVGYNNSDNSMQFTVNAAERARISGNNLFLNGGTDARIQLGSGGAGANSTANDTVHIRGDGDSMKLMAAADGHYIFEVNGSEKFRIASSGNVGIGVAPETAWGSNYTALDIGSAMSLWGSKAGASFAAMSDNIYFNNSAYKARNTQASAMYYQNAGAHFWNTGASVSADATITLVERMRIDSAGNVGLGTGSPKVLSGQTSLTINNNVPRIDFKVGDAFKHHILCEAEYIAIAADADNNQANSRIVFDVDGTTRMTIASAGNIGFNTSDFTTSNGSVGKTYAYEAASNNIVNVYHLNTATRHAIFEARRNGRTNERMAQISLGENSSAEGVVFIYGSAANADVSGGVNLTAAATSFSGNSDIRLKTVTGTYDNALQDIAKIEPIKFTWKADSTNKANVGVSAQSVQKVVPEAVVALANPLTPDDETEYLNVKYTELIPLMIASIQELSVKNDALEARLTALEG